jgi:hypothetical protein
MDIRRNMNGSGRGGDTGTPPGHVRHVGVRLVPGPWSLFPVALLLLLPAHARWSPVAVPPAQQLPRIVLDGAFEDWMGVPLAYGDPRDARDTASVDFGRLWITQDEDYLLLRLEVGVELSLQSRNAVTLYLDTDDDPATGLAVRGIGADLAWTFGRRRGRLFTGGDTVAVTHADVGLITAPTVTSAEFEIAFARDAEPIPGVRLFPGRTIRLSLAVASPGGGDILPDPPIGIPYTFVDVTPPALPAVALRKAAAGHLRVLSYNTNNRLFDPERAESYRRIVTAIAPDLVLWQEVRDHGSEDVLAYVGDWLAAPPGGWHHASAGGEATVLLSPFPIARVDSLGGSAAFLLDVDPASGSQLLLVGLSVPCCDQDVERQHELDLIVAFLRDARAPGGVLTLEPNTPIALVGDANLVGLARQRRTLLEGDIADEAQFGPDAPPDWDGSALTDLIPRHTHRPTTFTWYGTDFSPGRLDYVIYTDAVLDVGNRFVLYTPELPEPVLARWGLERNDTDVATDHLPVVADFVLP